MKNKPQNFGTFGDAFSVNNPDIIDIEGLSDEERLALFELLKMHLEEGL
jgi:hypothetical protein